MSDDTSLAVEERLFQLLQHLGIKQAHFAAHLPADWRGCAVAHPEMITSLTLVCPPRMDAGTLAPCLAPLLVFTGDGGRADANLQKELSARADSVLCTLAGYPMAPWADAGADRTDEIGSAIVKFLAQVEQQREIEEIDLGGQQGEVAGLPFYTQGAGTPLILLPLGLAPSQWEPLVPRLSEHHCTIIVQGSALGYAAIIETRGRSSGYLNVVHNLVNEVHIQPGEEILEVGCGTGVISRWIAHQTKPANRIIGIDINAYFIREAKHLAAKEDLENVIEFQAGNAEALPFADKRFDVVLSFTVMEEVDAGQMLAEMVRVAKPGGKVGVLVRSVDMPVFVNLPLRREVKAKVEAPPIWWGGVQTDGCADVSLYKRFHAAGLSDVKMMPQLATYVEQERLQRLYPLFVPLLDPAEVAEWWAAVAQAEAEGTAFIAQPFHSAVGKVPLPGRNA